MLAVLCVIGFSSCDKEETEPKGEQVDLYFEADMDGKSLLLPEGKDGYESQAVAYEPTAISGCVDRQAMRLAKGLDLKKSLEVALVKGTENCMTTCEQVEEMFQVGSYPFRRLSTEGGEGTVSGVVIRYTDVNGKIWSTDFGSGDQTGSSFSIVEHKANAVDTKSKKITTAEFNCKLYDGSGSEIVLENGRIVSRSVQCGYLK
mgnify:CR=1 FL=1